MARAERIWIHRASPANQKQNSRYLFSTPERVHALPFVHFPLNNRAVCYMALANMALLKETHAATPVLSGRGSTRLAPHESGVIEIFVRLSRVLGQPRSLGEIYGLLFISPRPLA